MMRISPFAVILVPLLASELALGSASHAQPSYATGAVSSYSPCGITPDLPADIPEARAVQSWFSGAGFPVVSVWEDGDVWGSDFRDGTDLDPGGGSDAAQIYYFTGHGICQVAPTATDSDNILVCGNSGTPNNTVVGASSRWGNSGGKADFILLDASCPMDLVSLPNQWFPTFQGLHVAVGHSGTKTADTLESVTRGNDFASYLVGHTEISFASFPLPDFWWVPAMSVGDAWMATGIEDVQDGCCAVALALGNDRDDAIDRRDNERLTDGRPDPVPNWAAWRWICE